MTHYIADLHFHSKYSRAVSPMMDLEHFVEWAQKKGIALVTCTDFTHPLWFKELQQKLVPQENGLYKLKNDRSPIQFMLTTELSCIYSKNNRTRRLHIVIMAPNLATVEKINAHLSWIGNLKADGRPILGLDAKELAKIVLEISPDCLVIPAHVWTPWFSLYGSNSGFDSMRECFEEYTDRIYAIETGLSSDPPMNWRLKDLDTKSIVSFSDAHSPANLGREATVFDLETLSYQNIAKAIKQGDPKNQIAYTIEFFPEEGMYHWDGHRKCDVRFSPQETREHKEICPKCGRHLTVGVMNRVEKLADRQENKNDPKRKPYKSLIPLQEIIADSLGVGKGSKAVMTEYENLIQQGGSEFNILLKLTTEELKKFADEKIVEGIVKVRQGQVTILPGYDGVYGTIKVFDTVTPNDHGQKKLF